MLHTCWPVAIALALLAQVHQTASWTCAPRPAVHAGHGLGRCRAAAACAAAESGVGETPLPMDAHIDEATYAATQAARVEVSIEYTAANRAAAAEALRDIKTRWPDVVVRRIISMGKEAAMPFRLRVGGKLVVSAVGAAIFLPIRRISDAIDEARAERRMLSADDAQTAEAAAEEEEEEEALSEADGDSAWSPAGVSRHGPQAEAEGGLPGPVNGAT